MKNNEGTRSDEISQDVEDVFVKWRGGGGG
jgi:hypothetical protein